MPGVIGHGNPWLPKGLLHGLSALRGFLEVALGASGLVMDLLFNLPLKPGHWVDGCNNIYKL